MPGTKAGDIIQVMSPGFTIGERLLRPAQVGVSSGGPAMRVAGRRDGWRDVQVPLPVPSVERRRSS